MISFQNVTYVMLLPSTVLTGLLIYVVHKKSPPLMSRYKYVVMSTCLAVYQFDFVDTLLIPKIVPRAYSVEFHGLLGALFPLEGNRLVALFVCSIIVAWLSLLFSFVWREYSLLKFEVTKLSVFLNTIHFLCAAIPFVGVFPMLNRMFLDRSDYIAYAIQVEAPYDPNYAIFVYIPYKMPNFYQFLIYAFCTTAICATYIYKAIYRITKEVNKPRQYLSDNTIRMHKMLLKSLLWQVLTPNVVFLLPIAVVLALGFNHLPERFGYDVWETADFNTQCAAVALAIPSFYTTLHISSVIYFTTPYRQFVARLLPWSSNVPTQVLRCEATNSVTKPRRQSEQLVKQDFGHRMAKRVSSPVE